MRLKRAFVVFFKKQNTRIYSGTSSTCKKDKNSHLLLIGLQSKSSQPMRISGYVSYLYNQPTHFFSISLTMLFESGWKIKGKKNYNVQNYGLLFLRY